MRPPFKNYNPKKSGVAVACSDRLETRTSLIVVAEEEHLTCVETSGRIIIDKDPAAFRSDRPEVASLIHNFFVAIPDR